MFRGLTIYQLTQPVAAVMERLSEALADESRHFADCTPHSRKSTGFVSPLGLGSDVLSYETSAARLFCVRHDEKEIPAGAVKIALQAWRAGKEAEGEEVNKTDERIARDALVEQMLPGAIPAPSWTYAYLDKELSMLFVGAGEDGADQFIEWIKGPLQGCPFKLLGLNDLEATDKFTEWLRSPEDSLPEDLSLGAACSLKHPQDGGTAINKISHEDLNDAEYMPALLDAGYKCCQVALEHPQVNFAITANLGLRRLGLTDEVKAELEEHDSGVPADNRAAEFAAWVAGIRVILAELEALLGGWPEQAMLDLGRGE